jgi:hypothetical protein
MKYDIVDNFLNRENFKMIEKELFRPTFPWFYNSSIADPTDDDMPYFTHHFYLNDEFNSDYRKLLLPILDKMKIKTLMRAKANMYLKTNKVIKHGLHVDRPFKHKGCIFYINTNNGFTVLEDGTEIKSVANRALFFDSSKKHSSTSCTDQNIRVNININYF